MFGIKTRLVNAWRVTRVSRRTHRILSSVYGQARSVAAQSSVDAEGNPLAWITYPAIDYLLQLDLSELRMFEYGSGNSTLFWAARVKSLISIEDDRKWHEKMQAKIPGNANYVFVEKRADYAGMIRTFDGQFDVIFIDGIDRYDCAVACQEKLARTGMVILDNSEWCPRTCEFLRDKMNLIEVDMYGFTPINDHTQCTSFFFSREAVLKPRGRQPSYLPGNEIWSEDKLALWVRG